MAFTHLGNRGHTSSKGNATADLSITSLSPNQTIPVGSFVVVWSAGDSFHVANGEGDPVPWTQACFDSAGNTYVIIAGGTDGQSNIYSQCAIYVAFVSVAITTSHTIEVRQKVGSSGQIAPRAMSVHEFSVDSDKVWAVADGGAQKATNRAGDPPSITWSSGKSSQEYLILHALSAEGPETDTYTWDSDYTQITGDGTTGGTADSNIHLRGGFRIATITSDTVDVTAGTPTRDYTQVMQAITEIGSRRALSFPRNPTILDNFNRADENPVAGGWDTTGSSPRSNGATTRHLRITSNQLRDSSASPGLGGSWYTGGSFTSVPVCDGFDAFMTLAVAEQATLSMRGSGSSEAGTADGLAMEYVTSYSSTSQFVASQHIPCGSLGSQGRTDQVRGRAWVVMSNGWKMGLSMVRVADSPSENYVYYWLNRGSGWEIMFAIHGFGGNFTGFNTGTAVKIGVGIDNAATRVDDVGGGPTTDWCQAPFKPQIYRWVTN